MYHLYHYSIRGFLWLFYATLFAWLLCPDFLASFLVSFSVWLVEDHSFRAPVVLGTGVGIVFSIGEVVRRVKPFSVGYLFLIVLGLSLVALAHLVCRYFGISLEAIPPGPPGPWIRKLLAAGAGFLTAGIIPMAASRSARRPN
jgi:hypothetical protein